jgi:hypothetical protein
VGRRKCIERACTPESYSTVWLRQEWRPLGILAMDEEDLGIVVQALTDRASTMRPANLGVRTDLVRVCYDCAIPYSAICHGLVPWKVFKNSMAPVWLCLGRAIPSRFAPYLLSPQSKCSADCFQLERRYQRLSASVRPSHTRDWAPVRPLDASFPRTSTYSYIVPTWWGPFTNFAGSTSYPANTLT